MLFYYPLPNDPDQFYFCVPVRPMVVGKREKKVRELGIDVESVATENASSHQRLRTL